MKKRLVLLSITAVKNSALISLKGSTIKVLIGKEYGDLRRFSSTLAKNIALGSLSVNMATFQLTCNHEAKSAEFSAVHVQRSFMYVPVEHRCWTLCRVLVLLSCTWRT